ncbi:MAG: Tol-Pal system protein TolB [Sulfurovum sp.]|nr:Tol-Pal system protein TolB [Sulfurovum sp.]MCB4759701.1 Tol-Pal system protein TolB [Sulfurovum sp.]
MRYLLFLFIALSLHAKFDATLTIEKDVEHRTKIALEDSSVLPNKQLFKMLVSDLKISGHFLVDEIVYQGSFKGNVINPALKSQEYILKYTMQEGSGVRLSVRLLKASTGREIFKKSYTISLSSKMPFLAHKAVWDINNILKYPNIDWINRYVVFAQYTTSKHSKIILADYTFTYKKPIISGGLNLFPRWADKNQRSFYYTSLRGTIPTLYRLNIYTGAKTKIASSEGMIVCSDVSKNTKKILLTMAPSGQPDIYELNLLTGRKIRITRFNGIDVNGKYINDERRIVFVSNRLGYANIFRKDIHGSAISQVVYHGRNNDTVDAYGSRIVYASRESNNVFRGNTFNIYLASMNDATTRPLTVLGSNQFPHFSSNGSIVQYIKQTQNGFSVGYINLQSKQSLLIPLGGHKIQALDW